MLKHDSHGPSLNVIKERKKLTTFPQSSTSVVDGVPGTAAMRASSDRTSENLSAYSSMVCSAFNFCSAVNLSILHCVFIGIVVEKSPL